MRWTVSPGSRAPSARSSPRCGRWCRGDQFYRAKRTLLPGADLLIDTQVRCLEALFARERHTAVEANWRFYQRLIQTYRAGDPGLGRFLMQRAIDSLRDTVPDELEEVAALARSLIERRTWPISITLEPPTVLCQAVTGHLSISEASPWESGA